MTWSPSAEGADRDGSSYHVAVDGATRRACSEILADEKKATVCGLLCRTVAWSSARGIVVERILTNGPAYRPHPHRDTRADLSIRHSGTRAYRPQAGGTAERFIKTLAERWAYGAGVRSLRQCGARIAWSQHAPWKCTTNF